MAITSDRWTLDSSAQWTTAADWSLGTLPNATNDAVVSPTSGTAQFNLTLTGGATVNSLSGVSFAELEIGSLSSAGTLTVNLPTNASGAAATWAGLLQANTGMLDVRNGWTIGSTADFFSGTTLEVDAGTLDLAGGGVLDGILTGNGLVALAGGGASDIGAGFNFTAGTLSIASVVNLDGSVTVGAAGTLALQAGGNFRLNGFTFTDGAVLNLGGLVSGPGTLVENGAAVVQGLTIQSNVTAKFVSTAIVSGSVTVFNTSDLLVAFGANYNLTADVGAIGDTSSTIDIEGALNKTGGTGISSIVAGTVDLHGTLTVGSGTIALAFTTLDLTGSIAGPGRVVFETGSISVASTANFAAGSSVEFGASSVATLHGAVTANGAFTLDGATTSGMNTDPAATIDLNNQTLTLAGISLLSGVVTDTSAFPVSALAIGGTATFAGLTVGGGNSVQITGTAIQTGALSLLFNSSGAGAALLRILSGGTDDITGDFGIAEGGGGVITVSGVLEKTAGTATSTVSGSLLLIDGTINVATGTMELSGDQTGDVVTINSGTVTGSGLLLLDNAAGATADAGSKQLVINGTVEMTGSRDLISGMVNGTGSLLVQNATSVTLGAVAVTTSLSLGSLSFIDQTVSLGVIDVRGATVTVGGTLDVAAIGTTIAIDGVPASGTADNTLDLTGTGALDGVFNGSGTGGAVFFTALAGLTIAAGGDYEMTGVDFGGGVTLDNYGNVIADGGIVLDSDASAKTSELLVEATGTFHLAASGTAIGKNGASAAIVNNGLIEKHSGSGASTIDVGSFVNTGTISVSSGTLAINGFVNSAAGDIEIGAGANLMLTNGYSGIANFEGKGSTLSIGPSISNGEGVSGFVIGDTIDVIGTPNASVALQTTGRSPSSLFISGQAFVLIGDGYDGVTFTTKSDGHGGTDIGLAVPAASGSLPEADTALTSPAAAVLNAQLATLIPASGMVNVVSVAGGASGPTIAGALNALAVTSSGAGSVIALPAGFTVGYLLGGNGNLSDSIGGALLIATSAGGALTGAASDTLYGGNAGNTLFATIGAETLIGGTGTNSIFLGSSTALVQSNGTDLITGSSGAETVTATGSVLYFGTSGATNFTARGNGGDTLIGGNGGNTITGGGGSQLIFGSTSLNYTGGTGAATIIGGGTGNTVTGGAGNLLLFASSSLTYTGTGGAATIIGGGGAMSVNLGTGGGVVYGSPNGSDTLISGSGLSILVGGGNGDVVVATGAANDTLVAGAGAETLSGSGSSGSLVLFGGSGADVMAGGSGRNLFIAGTANETLAGGAGPNDIILAANTGTSRVDVITGFNTSTDAVGLFGFGAEPGADAAALKSAASDGDGNTVVSLSDGTKIVFTGAPELNANNFF